MLLKGFDMTLRFITVRVLSGTTISMLSFSELIIRHPRRKPWVLESVFSFLLAKLPRTDLFFTTEEAIIEGFSTY